VRSVTSLVATCVAVALVLACLVFGPQGSGLSGDDGNDDAPLSLDVSTVLPAAPFEPLLVPPLSGLVFVDHRPPPSRLTTAEVFRPPRAAG
jgi:hypothetical protein